MGHKHILNLSDHYQEGVNIGSRIRHNSRARFTLRVVHLIRDPTCAQEKQRTARLGRLRPYRIILGLITNQRARTRLSSFCLALVLCNPHGVCDTYAHTSTLFERYVK